MAAWSAVQFRAGGHVAPRDPGKLHGAVMGIGSVRGFTTPKGLQVWLFVLEFLSVLNCKFDFILDLVAYVLRGRYRTECRAGSGVLLLGSHAHPAPGD